MGLTTRRRKYNVLFMFLNIRLVLFFFVFLSLYGTKGHLCRVSYTKKGEEGSTNGGILCFFVKRTLH
jgi:hypothetical protein